MRLTAVLMWNSAQREMSNFCFSRVFCWFDKAFILAGGLGAGLSFFGVWTVSWYFRQLVVRQLVRQLVYTMFISNNRPSFHLWWKENLVKHQKVSKYYETDCRLGLNIDLTYFYTYIFKVSVNFFCNSHIQPWS